MKWFIIRKCFFNVCIFYVMKWWNIYKNFDNLFWRVLNINDFLEVLVWLDSVLIRIDL